MERFTVSVTWENGTSSLFYPKADSIQHAIWKVLDAMLEVKRARVRRVSCELGL